MGYTTFYKLSTVVGSVADEESFLRDFENSTGYDMNRYYGGDADWYTDGKWYEHEADMRSISMMHDGVVFKLEGWGEEPGDWWVKYFKGGKMYDDRPSMPEYDPSRWLGR